MYPEPWDALPDFAAHDWPRHGGEQTLGELADRVCQAFGIRDGDTVVGASLGGMVGCEIAQRRRLDALYLVGSATHRHEVSRLLEILHPLADLPIVEWFQSSAVRIPSDLTRMFASSDPAFIRQMAKAIFAWEGSPPVAARRFRIHGRRDRVIPAPAHVDLLLEGGHLISMTHAVPCVEFIRAQQRILARLALA